MFDKQKQQYELIKKAKQMQKELKETEIEARSKDGRIVAVFNGEQHLVSVEINEPSLDAGLKKELEKALVMTISEGISRAQAVSAEKAQEMMKDMNMNFPGM